MLLFFHVLLTWFSLFFFTKASLIISNDDVQYTWNGVYPVFSLFGPQSGHFQLESVHSVSADQFEHLCNLDFIQNIQSIFGQLTSNDLLMFDAEQMPYDLSCNGRFGAGDEFIRYWCAINATILRIGGVPKPGIWANRQYGGRFRTMNQLYPNCIILETELDSARSNHDVFMSFLSENNIIQANINLTIDNNPYIEWLGSPAAIIFLRVLPSIGFGMNILFARSILLKRIETKTLGPHYRNICIISIIQGVILMIVSALGNRFVSTIVPVWMVSLTSIDFVGFSLAADAWLMLAYIRYYEQLDVTFAGTSSCTIWVLRSIPTCGILLDLVIGLSLVFFYNVDVLTIMSGVLTLIIFVFVALLTFGIVFKSFSILQIFQNVSNCKDSSAVEMPLVVAFYRNLRFSVIGLMISTGALILLMFVFMIETPLPAHYPGFFVFWAFVDYVSIARMYFHLSYCRVVRTRDNKVYSDDTTIDSTVVIEPPPLSKKNTGKASVHNIESLVKNSSRKF